ncbi:hypothetical protein MSAS_27250 [Mycobacterium saskatchewanense]|nr:hypothetical protein MSAS_27250 [Mycobacterium saskatchewanense]
MKYRPGFSGQRSASPSSAYPAAPNRAATVAQAWYGDGDASMNSQRPAALADMPTIIAPDAPRRRAGHIARLLTRAAPDAPRRRAGHTH